MPGNKRKKAGKFLELLADASDPQFEGQPGDIVIPVMGPTGVGKSSFINALLATGADQVATIGHELKSCTTELKPIVVPDLLPDHIKHDSGGKERRLIVVDTPGFNDTFLDDAEVLRRISVWLALSQDMKLGGIIYLYDISMSRMLGQTHRNLEMFKSLVGTDALGIVALVTTKWSLVPTETGQQRQTELQQSFWADMCDAGSRIFESLNDNGDKSPRSIMRRILRDKNGHVLDKQNVLIQRELVEMKKFIPETEAGKTLRYAFANAIHDKKTKVEKLSMQKHSAEDLEREKECLRKLSQIYKDMKVPFFMRIKRLFA